jgi:tryptophanyl-tRNA synthetase
MYSAAGKGLFVPVGEDQVSHVEFSRELVRRFNLFYGFQPHPDLFRLENWKLLSSIFDEVGRPASIPPLRGSGQIPLPEDAKLQLLTAIRNRALEVGVANFLEKVPANAKHLFGSQEVLTEPGVLLTQTPRVPGLDGRKMSKSYGNAITLSESDDDIRKKTKVMVTDPARKRRTDPGNPDVCPVYDWHKLFSTPERDPNRLDWVRKGCTTAGIGCIECKSAMAENLIKWITPVREKRLDYEAHPKKALEILDQGSTKARESAKQTMQRVRNSIFNWPRKRSEIG